MFSVGITILCDSTVTVPLALKGIWINYALQET